MKKSILFLLMLFIASSIVTAVNIEDVNTVEIEPGKTGIISFNVKNDHNFDVEDISIILDLSGEIPFAPYHSSAEAFIGELDEGDDESVSFQIICSADAEIGLYKIPVLISYKDEDGDSYNKIDFISVLIVSKPKLSVLLDDPNYVIGAKSDLSIRIINSGFSDVKFLKVRILNSGFYEVISSKEVYVGDLDSDDFDNVDFSLRFNYPLPTKISLPVMIEYYDANNNYYSERFDLNLPIYNEEQAKQLGLIESSNLSWVFFVVIFVVFFIIYRIRRKRKKRKNDIS